MPDRMTIPAEPPLGPWAIHENDGIEATVRDYNDHDEPDEFGVVCRAAPGDARFIVHACNNYSYLVQALDELIELCNSYEPSMWADEDHTVLLHAIYVLQKARNLPTDDSEDTTA